MRALPTCLLFLIALCARAAAAPAVSVGALAPEPLGAAAEPRGAAPAPLDIPGGNASLVPNKILPGNILYFGGEVMGGDSQGRLPLIVILYGHFSALDSDYVLRFLGDLGNSAWWGISKVYADTKKFVGVPYVAKVFRDPGSQGLNGAKPEKIIKANSPNGYSATALYVILHGTDSQPANLASDNSAFCDSWVGYHSAYQQWTSWFTYTFVKYAVIGHPQACPGYHGLVFTGGPGGMVRDELCSTTAHEISEAATNPHGTYYGFFWSTIKKPAWKDGKGSENADKCLGEFGKYKYGKVGSKSYKYNVLANGRPYLIQTNWDRYRQTCVQGR